MCMIKFYAIHLLKRLIDNLDTHSTQVMFLVDIMPQKPAQNVLKDMDHHGVMVTANGVMVTAYRKNRVALHQVTYYGLMKS